MGSAVEVTSTVFLALHLVTVLFMLTLLYKLFARLSSACLMWGDSRPQNIKSLVALFIASVIFSQVFTAIVTNTIAVFATALDFGSSFYVDTLRETLKTLGTASFKEFALVLAATYLEWLSDYIKYVTDALLELGQFVVRDYDLNVKSDESVLFAFVPFFLSFLAVRSLLVSITKGSPNNTTLKDWIESWMQWQKQNSALVKNVSLSGLLMVAAYLSFGAIAAIPSLTIEAIPDDMQPDKLTVKLTRIAEAVTKYDVTHLESFPVTVGTAQGDTGGESESVHEMDRELLPGEELWRVKRQSLLLMLKDRAKGFAADVDYLRDAAATVYQTANLKRVGTRATIDHYQAINLWYSQVVSRRVLILRQCSAAIRQWDFGFWELVGEKSRSGEQTKSGIVARPSVSGEGYGSMSSSASSKILEASAFTLGPASAAMSPVCPDVGPTNVDSPPNRGDAKKYLGKVGSAIGWILEAESLPMVLIVGLAGFGLLGATCSTFVREKIQRSQEGEGTTPEKGVLVSDLAGVIVRGLSAAIVVFLAVYGGLAVFSSNASPNPYAVLFVCFVGAVFSEVVWNWARGIIEKSFSVNKEVHRVENEEEGVKKVEEGGAN